MKLIKKQLVTAILASTFSLGAHAVGINFDGGFGLIMYSCTFKEDTEIK